jgi:hypothetical protein
VSVCHGQGTTRVTFDGWPPGTAVLTQRYQEAGFWFSPIPPITWGNALLRTGPGIQGTPQNGTAYI